MHILDDLDDRSVVKREIRQLCNHIGISFESEFPEDPKFILDVRIRSFRHSSRPEATRQSS